MLLPIVCLDEHQGYVGLDLLRYIHQSVNQSAKQLVDGMWAHTNEIGSVCATLKRGYYDIHHHISIKHLFRYNEGNVKVHRPNQTESMAKEMFGKKLTYKALIGKLYSFLSPYIKHHVIIRKAH
uniref:ISXO2-like transposase domain-containing protein n=1 Tax=Candidatus Kentrum sp. MB TaxID=2138164 RepID=A0A450XX21_9GAMM|nr:MAG: ISXO2-like transposase domain-containing protein [Candidatus Kentron sp. MB]VFK33787.1 MAG: ISXO2-like transposase domain-containing protein [Candidatus Kentron sp. MB]VFK76384.1 MAG: ISXO2-like transposase domain-containing protein [Candidatus Kentron sp. MB]